MSTEAYTRLIELLDSNAAQYRILDHEPEGRTEIVSAMRGNPVEQAAKCLRRSTSTPAGSTGLWP